jgi:hypothetical protein
MIKAWITERVDPKETGTALGFYTSMESISIWLASGVAGTLWTVGYPSLPFFTSALVALLVAAYLGLFMKSKTQ